ncbi:MAG: hypothetical protein KDC38_02210 [Planctomycetes bacterium]|nr:hypothetical protein [Planctomycetota bacterium]
MFRPTLFLLAALGLALVSWELSLRRTPMLAEARYDFHARRAEARLADFHAQLHFDPERWRSGSRVRIPLLIHDDWIRIDVAGSARAVSAVSVALGSPSPPEHATELSIEVETRPQAIWIDSADMEGLESVVARSYVWSASEVSLIRADDVLSPVDPRRRVLVRGIAALFLGLVLVSSIRDRRWNWTIIVAPACLLLVLPWSTGFDLQLPPRYFLTAEIIALAIASIAFGGRARRADPPLAAGSRD